MQTEYGPYEEAHIFVAAIRVISYQKKAPPSVEDVCDLLSKSLEWGYKVTRQLKSKGIVNVIEDPFVVKIFVEDHLRIENLPRQEDESDLDKELARFQKEKKNMDKKVKDIQVQLDKEKKNLFADLGEKLKNQTKEER